MSNPVRDALEAAWQEVTHLPRFVHEIDGFIEHVRFDEVLEVLDKAKLASPDAWEWQPISTAPTDRTEIIVWFPDYGRPVMAHRTKESYRRPAGWVFAVSGAHHYRYETPTHWHPLPPAPGKKVRDQETEAQKLRGALSTAHKVFAAEVGQLQAIIKQQAEALDAAKEVGPLA